MIIDQKYTGYFSFILCEHPFLLQQAFILRSVRCAVVLKAINKALKSRKEDEPTKINIFPKPASFKFSPN